MEAAHEERRKKKKIKELNGRVCRSIPAIRREGGSIEKRGRGRSPTDEAVPTEGINGKTQ